MSFSVQLTLPRIHLIDREKKASDTKDKILAQQELSKIDKGALRQSCAESSDEFEDFQACVTKLPSWAEQAKDGLDSNAEQIRKIERMHGELNKIGAMVGLKAEKLESISGTSR